MTQSPNTIGIILDNGHGTRDYTAGKRSPNGMLIEGEYVRDIVKRLSGDLKVLGFDVRVIVPEDKDIALSERVRRANKIMADNPGKKWYYISVHINAAGYGGGWYDASGWSVYVSTKSSKESKGLAQAMYSVAETLGLMGNRSVPLDKYWQANYTVITDTKMPAILTENMFMDNRKDCEFLLSEGGRRTIVDVHLFGICKYFGLPYVIKIGKR